LTLRIAWVSNAPLHMRDGTMESSIATARYRMLLPARELAQLGHRVEFVDLRASIDAAERAVENAEAVVFSKALADQNGSFDRALGALGPLYRRAIASGRRVVVDLNDDHFATPAFRDFYAGLKPHAWVCSTEEMAGVVVQFVAGAAPAVIPDPFEGPAGLPCPPVPTRFPSLFRLLNRVTPRRLGPWKVSLLWFGHPAGFQELRSALPEIEQTSGRMPMHLECVSLPGAGIENTCAEQNAKRSSLSMSFTPWSIEETWRALRACDLVVLPAAHGTRKARAKSANRLIESIRAGRFAVCHPLPSYQSLAPFAFVGESLAQGLAWSLDHPMEVVEKLGAGQRHVDARFSPAVVAQAWLRVLNTPA
jgi:hypothetical protein